MKLDDGHLNPRSDMAQGAGTEAFLKLLGHSVSGLMICLLAVVLTISFGTIIFSGPLAAFVSQGISLALFGGLVLAFVGAATTSYRGTICHPQSVTAVILSLSATTLANRLAHEDPQVLFASVAVLVAVASMAAGLVFFAAGALRLGSLARFIPYPVLGGFLAATGYLLTLGAVGMVAGEPPSLRVLAEAGRVGRWLPVVVLAAALVWTARWTKRPLVLPAFLALAFAGFYAWLWLAGIDLEEAGRRGLLLGPFDPGQGFGVVFGAGVVSQADLGAVLNEWPAVLTLVGLALVGAMLNASGIELATGESVDVNRDLRGVGLGNVLAGAGGGLAGYHVLSETLLAHRMLASSSRWVGISVGAACGLALFAGAEVLSALPISVFAVVLAYLGLDLLYEWLWVERRRMPVHDFALVVLILAAAATVGFLEAIALGVLAATVFFILAYSKLDVIRSRSTLTVRRSTTERAEAASRLLSARGGETLIFELQGYVFFGTAYALYRQLAAEIDQADSTIRNAILDFRHIQGLDVSAVFNFGKLEQVCQRRGTALLITGLSPRLRRPMELAGLASRVRFLPTLDAAIADIEDSIVAEATDLPQEQDQASILVDLLERAKTAWPEPLTPVTIQPRTEVLFQGEASDCLILLQSGRMSATVTGPDGAKRKVATFLPGTVIGEIGLYAAVPRSATVSADVPCEIVRITKGMLDRLSEQDPALARDLHASVAALLARRLMHTTAMLNEVVR